MAGRGARGPTGDPNLLTGRLGAPGRVCKGFGGLGCALEGWGPQSVPAAGRALAGGGRN
jgi:hypothetical protein